MPEERKPSSGSPRRSGTQANPPDQPEQGPQVAAEENSRLKTWRELARLRKEAEMRRLKTEEEINRIQLEAEQARLEAGEKVAAARAEERAELRQLREEMNRVVRQEELRVRHVEGVRERRRPPWDETTWREAPYDEELGGRTTWDAPDRLFDLWGSIARASTLSYLHQLRIVADIAGSFTDSVLERSRERAESGLSEETSWERSAQTVSRPRRTVRSSRRRQDVDAMRHLPSDVYSGLVDAIDELLQLPERWIDHIQESYDRPQRR